MIEANEANEANKVVKEDKIVQTYKVRATWKSANSGWYVCGPNRGYICKDELELFMGCSLPECDIDLHVKTSTQGFVSGVWFLCLENVICDGKAVEGYISFRDKQVFAAMRGSFDWKTAGLPTGVPLMLTGFDYV